MVVSNVNLMNDSRTGRLVVTNLLLGLAVLLLLIAILARVVWDLLLKLRKRRAIDAELDADMRHLFHGARHR